jgi:hypothetical protein
LIFTCGWITLHPYKDKTMTQAELIKQLSKVTGKVKVLELSRILKEKQFSLHDLIDLTLYADKHVAFRAAWIWSIRFWQI